MTHTPTGAQTGDQQVLLEFYDAFMAMVEPDLVSANIATVYEKYKDETDADRTTRGERYAKAYDLFAQTLDSLLDRWKHDVAQFKKHAYEEYSQTNASEEKGRLQQIDTELQQS
ncbi:MAG: hypothetical protein Q7R81_06475 [Candidatus Peregrinibacteria bacterium]|nr:hypothetical protein [Candidatus Peregrinibacteria bacterium]